MTAEIVRLRDKAGETEKITINLGYVDLGRIDLLVQEGFYSNRTDFIRTAIPPPPSCSANPCCRTPLLVFRPPLALGRKLVARRSGNPSCGTRSSSACGITRGRIWRP